MESISEVEGEKVMSKAGCTFLIQLADMGACKILVGWARAN